MDSQELLSGSNELVFRDSAQSMETSAPENARFLLAAVEALVFASVEPLTEQQYRAVLGERATEPLSELVRQLNYEYERDGRAFEILPVANGYQFFTRRDYSGILRKHAAERARNRVSRAALETLAIIAYRGPVTRAEIDEIRGVDSGGVLRTLLDRRLVAVKGRANVLGRPLLYVTTPEFLSHFGLFDLADLPRETELLREWGQSRSLEDVAAMDVPSESPQVELEIPGNKDNGRLEIQPTNETSPEKDA